MEVFNWSITDANNNGTPPSGWPENMAYSSVNNTARACLGAAARLFKDNNGSLASTGSASAYVVASNVNYSAVSDVPVLVFRANHANTGAATLNVDATGVKDLRDSQGTPLVAGQIVVGQHVSVRYDATSGYYRALSITPTLSENIAFTPTTAGDWDTSPTEVAGAIDVLADRTAVFLDGVEGDLLVHDGASWTKLAQGTEGQYLAVVPVAYGGTGHPEWSAVPASPECWGLACGGETEVVTTGVKHTLIAPYSFIIEEVKCSLTTAQASGNLLTVDIKEGGVSIFTTKITFDNNELGSFSATTAPVLTSSPYTITGNAKLEVEVTQVGDGTAAGLKAYIVGRFTLGP